MPPIRRKAQLKEVYARIIEVYKTDPELEWQQLENRFGIGYKKIMALRKQALEPKV